MLDVIASVKYLKSIHQEAKVEVVGAGDGAILAAYAALWAPEIDGVKMCTPHPTHMDSAAPQFLNILRVADVPEILGLLAPRPLTITSSDKRFQKTASIYAAAGGNKQFTLTPIRAESQK